MNDDIPETVVPVFYASVGGWVVTSDVIGHRERCLMVREDDYVLEADV